MNRVIKKAQQLLDIDAAVEASLQAKLKDLRKQLAKESKPFRVSGAMSPLVGAEYTILEVDQPCNFWGFIDISDLRAGDAFKLEVKFKSLDGKYKAYISKEYTAPLPSPMLDFDSKNTLGVIISIKQPSGFPDRKVLYNFDWSPL